MCVIAYKPVGKDVFSKETLNKCWEANDHGAGYAWWDRTEGFWQVRKGFMSWKKFWKAFKAQDFQQEDCVIAHFRIGTAGLRDGGNTHPFPVCDDMDLMRLMEFKAESLLFHNGVVGSGEGDYSDTMVFIRDYIAPVIHLLGTDERIPKIIEKICSGHSRFIITKGAELWKFGTTWVERHGCWFSNSSWEYKTTSHYGAGYTGAGFGSGAGFTGNYGAGSHSQPWRRDDRFANEYGHYVNGKWTRWDENPTGADFTQIAGAGTVVDFTKAKKRKKAAAKETKDKEDHSRTKTLFIVAGDDGSVKFADNARAYLRKHGIKYLICPNCYEDKYIDESPEYAIVNGGESMCRHCGTIFNDLTGEIVCVDLAIHRRAKKTFDDVVRKPSNWATMTAAERQIFTDSQTDEMLNQNYL